MCPFWTLESLKLYKVSGILQILVHLKSRKFAKPLILCTLEQTSLFKLSFLFFAFFFLGSSSLCFLPVCVWRGRFRVCVVVCIWYTVYSFDGNKLIQHANKLKFKSGHFLILIHSSAFLFPLLQISVNDLLLSLLQFFISVCGK